MAEITEQNPGWRPASPREMIDWLAFFVLPQCQRREDHMMYMQVRDVIVWHFGMTAPRNLRIEPREIGGETPAAMTTIV